MKKQFILIVSLILFILSAPLISRAGEEIVLLFPKYEQGKSSEGKAVCSLAKNANNEQVYSEEGLKKFVQKFEGQGYKIDQIELWVERKAESGGITKFIVSVGGGGGIKIILRPYRQ